MSSIRWAGLTHAEIYQRVQAGPGRGASAAVESAWVDTEAVIVGIEQRLSEAIAQAGGGWEGSAAEATRAGLTPLGRWAADAAGDARLTATGVTAQGEQAGWLRAAMPSPAAPLWDEPGGRPVSDPLYLLADTQALEQRSAEDTAQAVHLMNTYTSNSYANIGEMDYWTLPPTVTVETGTAAAMGGGLAMSGAPLPGMDPVGTSLTAGPGAAGNTAGPVPGGPAGGVPGSALPAPTTAPGSALPAPTTAPGSAVPAPMNVPAGSQGGGRRQSTRGRSAGGLPRGGGPQSPAVPTSRPGDAARIPANSAVPRRVPGSPTSSGGGADRPAVPTGPTRRTALPSWRDLVPAASDPRAPGEGTARGTPGWPRAEQPGGSGRVFGESAPGSGRLPGTGEPVPGRVGVGEPGTGPGRGVPGAAVGEEPAVRGGTRAGALSHSGLYPPMMGMGVGGQDHEHRRPDFLLDDGNAFADDRWFPPPVIGADDLPPPRSP